MPRLKSDAERGWIGAWLRRQRVQRGWSPEQVVAHLPQSIRVDYYRGLEAGRRPGPELLADFQKLYGPMPPEPSDNADQPDIAAAITALTVAMQAQAAAMQEIVAEMRLARETTQGRSEGMAAALGDLAGTLESLRSELAERQGSRIRR